MRYFVLSGLQSMNLWGKDRAYWGVLVFKVDNPSDSEEETGRSV